MFPYLLVAGGAGFIGSHICRALSRAGIVPIVYDDLSTGHRDNVRWGPLIEGDLQDRRRLTTAIREYQPDGVIYCAARLAGGSLALLETCLDEGVDRFVFSCRSATNGMPVFLPIRDEMEQILEGYAAAWELRYVMLRYLHAIDDDMAENISECYGSASRSKACMSDCVEVGDLAQAHVAAVDHLLNGGVSLRLNLGSGHGTPVREVLESIRHVSGNIVPMTLEPCRSVDPSTSFSGPREAKLRPGFAPVFSDISSIVRIAAPPFGLKLSS